MAVRHWYDRCQRPLLRWLPVVLLLLVLAVAAGFRLYQIGDAPPGPHYDEAAAGLDALDVLAGRHMIFSPRSYGREMLFVYVAAPFVALLGPTRLALRLPIALVGILTILVTYLLTRELFSEQDKRQARWIALLAASFLSLSFWHLALNHLSFRANYLPLTEMLSFLFFWRAVRTRKVWSCVVSGFFLGLSFHTYAAARLLPFVMVIFFGALLLTRKGRNMVLPHWRRWLLLAAVAFLVAAPLIVFFLIHPEDLFLRTRTLSIFSPTLHKGDFWGLVTRSVVGNLGLFGWRGDPNWLYNIPGRPGLPLIQAVFFWLGLLLCLVRWRRPRYLFLLVWWLVMLLPSILAPDPIPHSLRAIGSLPAACILSALGLTEVASFLVGRFHRLRAPVSLSLAILATAYLAWIGYDTWHSYFDVWLPQEQVYYAYYGHMADLAEQINGNSDPEAVYIFPVNYDRRGEIYQEYPLDLLHEGPVPYHYIIVDDATVAEDLTEICAGKKHIYLVVWTHGKHVDADPRGVLPFFLERFGQQTEVRAYRGYQIARYELPSASVVFDLPEFTPVQANLDDQLVVIAQAHARAASSGGRAWVALRWRVKEDIASDYSASLRLLEPQGQRVGQSDTGLLSNEHQSTSGWVPSQTVTTYHLLSSLPATMPGIYQIELVGYDPETSRELQVLDEAGAPLGHSLALGTLEIGRHQEQPSVEPKTLLENARLLPDIALLGYDLDQRLYSPGETMHLALYWHALNEIDGDYAVTFQLVDEAGEVATEWTEAPGYPTSHWQAGDLWRDWHALRIAPDVPATSYQLKVRLASTPAEAVLGSIEIEGRARQFEVPAISHPQPAQLGEAIRFLGFDLEEEQVRAGDVLHLTLYWQCLAACDVSYTTFAHLLGGDSRIWGQKDSVPGSGTMPTTSWVSGEVIVDEYEIPVSADAPTGEYALEIGMYQAETGRRLPVYDPAGQALGDRILLEIELAVLP
jgi:4-amino-4-deoxy-L-arabinose transferase-like glycosyltransferase